MTKRVALVTGCGKLDGLGAAIATTLADAGVSLAVTDIAPEGLRNAPGDAIGKRAPQGIAELVTRLRAKGVEAEYFLGDVSAEPDAARLVKETVARFGRLDILVNNAAAPHGGEFNDIVDISLDAYDKVMNVNARGPFLMMRAAVPHMRNQKWGRIVNIGSVTGRVGRQRQAIYGASKAAVIQMTRCFATELGQDGINMNAVCPGRMLTSRAMSDALRRMTPEQVAEENNKRAADIPVRRISNPLEVAAVVAFLCSEAASYVTGQAVNVDGGMFPI